MLQNMLAIALGAAVGANLRYALSIWAARAFGTGFPAGTLLINLVGCLLIGLLLSAAGPRLASNEPLRLLLITGLLGGFTTFSSFGYETYQLMIRGQWTAAAIYAMASVGLGILGVALGAWLGRWLAGG